MRTSKSRLEVTRAWRARNVEKCREYGRRYYASHRAEHKAYYEAHVDLIKKAAKVRHSKRSDAERIFEGAKARAKKRSIPFEIELSDVIVPTHCPVFGIPLKRGIGKQVQSSPTLDRIIPKLGYVKGNVAVISLRANAIKQNATAEEIEKVAAWLKNATAR